jgi:hypothetical protein
LRADFRREGIAFRKKFVAVWISDGELDETALHAATLVLQAGKRAGLWAFDRESGAWVTR